MFDVRDCIFMSVSGRPVPVVKSILERTYTWQVPGFNKLLPKYELKVWEYSEQDTNPSQKPTIGPQQFGTLAVSEEQAFAGFKLDYVPGFKGAGAQAFVDGVAKGL